MLKIRGKYQIIWLSFFVLSISISCSEDKGFQGRNAAAGSEANNKGQGPRTTNEDDMPVQMPSMITASQFLMNCRLSSTISTASNQAFKVGCKVQSPYSPAIYESMEWSVFSENQQMDAQVVPSNGDMRAAEIYLKPGAIFPLRISSNISFRTKFDPMEVSGTYAHVGELLPEEGSKTHCHVYKDRAINYSIGAAIAGGIVGGIATAYAEQCFMKQVSTYLRCVEGKTYNSPKGC